MNPNLVTIEDLQKATGLTRVGDICKLLSDHGIKHIRTKQGIIVTIDAINKGLSADKDRVIRV